MTPANPLDMTIASLREGFARGDLTSRQAVQASLDRIAELDQHGPALNAVIELDTTALHQADERDADRANGTIRGPLHGVPILVKDNIAVTGMENTAGSLAMVGAKPREDAFLIRCLKDAGAVIIGKTNLCEWADMRSSVSISGWSGRSGQTRNPHQLDRIPSGSSGGSAAAVAAGYVPVALGTETAGSIASPATATGVVGIKPTVGLVSRMGVIPISQHQDTIGPMTRTVTDAAIVLSALAHADPNDPAVAEQASPPPIRRFPARPASVQDGLDYATPEILNADGLRNARIGVWRPRETFRQLTVQTFDASLQVLRDAGAELVEDLYLEAGLTEIDEEAELRVLLSELAPGVASYIDRYVTEDFPIRSMDDIIAFNREHADCELQWFGQDHLERSAAMPGLDDEEYLNALTWIQRRGREDGIDALIVKHGLDAIIAPSGPPASRIDPINGDHGLGSSFVPAAVAGYPIVTVPAGDHFGMPMSVSFFGTGYTEATLIRFAYAFEQATHARIDPTFTPGGLLPPTFNATDHQGEETG